MNKTHLVYFLVTLLIVQSLFLVFLGYAYGQLKQDDKLQTELYKATDAQLMWMEIKHNEPLDY